MPCRKYEIEAQGVRRHQDWSMLPEAEFRVEPLDDPVALTGGGFQFPAVHNRYRAPYVFYSSILLQDGGCSAYGRPTRPQHRREKIVGHGNHGRIHSVLGHQQPSRQAHFNEMQPVTSNRLRDLHTLNRGVTAEHHLKLWG